uniref:Probable RuBisCO transcriptional regulator n=1 Tax=Tanacetum cinerariifolium TaxID=118510 RepID=A0A699GFZ4_TANCI|nr:hypothetical protein [Tanacetum cinerariifolium]
MRDIELDALSDRATGRLLMADAFDEVAFKDLYSYVCTLAEKLKTENAVSKQFLAVVLNAASAIRSRAEYLPDVKKRIALADDFDMVLALVAVGEAPSDRRPGDGTSERPVATAWRPAFCHIVDAFVKGDYLLRDGVADVDPIPEETASHIQSYLSDYGATLKSLPDDAWNSSVCIWTGSHWDVLVDLYTNEEEASDLVLSARVTDTSHGFKIVVHMVACNIRPSNIPEALVFATETQLLLRYYISHEEAAVIQFPLVEIFQFGSPNDEALGGHPLSTLGLKFYSVHQIENSPWIAELARRNAVHPRHNKERFLQDTIHYVFTFQDSTLECVVKEGQYWKPVIKGDFLFAFQCSNRPLLGDSGLTATGRLNPQPRTAIHTELAGFVLAHCAAITDANRAGELICPFAVLGGDDGRQVVDFEAETQEEAVSQGWASLGEAKSSKVSWAFGREGLYRERDGNALDVLTVSVWMPGMTEHYSVLQRFGRREDQAIYLIGSPELLKHEGEFAEPVEVWNEKAIGLGIELPTSASGHCGVALVPQHPFARPFQARHRLRYPNIVRCALSEYGASNSCSSYYKIFAFMVMSGLTAISQAQEVGSRWRLRVMDLNHAGKVDATIRFLGDAATESCMGGTWRRAVVEAKTAQDENFFSLAEPLAYKIENGILTLGRTTVCDGYLFVSGKSEKTVIRGTYDSPQHRCREFFRLAHATNWLRLDDLSHDLRLSVLHAQQHGRVEYAWTHSVHADAARSVLNAGALGQAQYAMLGGVVGGAFALADQAAEGRTIDDRARALLFHLHQFMLHAGPDAAQVDAADSVVRGGAGGREWLMRSLDAGIVECHVDPSECGDGLFNQAGHLRFFGDIADEAAHVVSLGRQFCGGGGKRFNVVGRQDHFGAGFGERFCGGKTQSGTGAGRRWCDDVEPACRSFDYGPQLGRNACRRHVGGGNGEMHVDFGAGARIGDPVRVDHQPLANRHERQALVQRLCGLRGCFKLACRQQCNAASDVIVQDADDRGVGSAGDRLLVQRVAQRGVQVADAGIDQVRDELQRIGQWQSAVEILLDGNAVAQRERSVGMFGNLGLHRRHHRERKAHAVLERTAPSVDPDIRMRREEVLEQETVGAVQLNAVEAGCDGATCRRGEGIDDVDDFIIFQCPGNDGVRERAGMAGHRAGGDDFAKAGNEGVVIGSEFAGEAHTVGLHVGAAGDDQTDILCPASIVGVFLIRDGTVVVAGPGGHRRHHDANASGMRRRCRQVCTDARVTNESDCVVDGAHVCLIHPVTEHGEFGNLGVDLQDVGGAQNEPRAAKVVQQMGLGTRAWNRHDMRSLCQQPCQRYLRWRGAFFCRVLLEPRNDRHVQLQVLLREARELGAQVGRRIECRAGVDLPRQEAGADWGPGHETNARLGAGGQDAIQFNITGPQRVFRLNGAHRLDGMGAANGRDTCFRKAEMSDFALLDQILERTGDVLNRHARIDAMLIVQVDVIGAEALEGFFNHFADVLGAAIQAPFPFNLKTEFRGDFHFVPKWRKRLADEFFAEVRAVYFGGVEERDAVFIRCANRLDGLFFRNRRVVIAGECHAPEAEFRDLHGAQCALFHGFSFGRLPGRLAVGVCESLDDLGAFLAVAMHQSFTRAAAQLGISQPALSAKITALEARLGVRLLTRSTRSVSTTNAGERLAKSIGPHFDGIASGLADLGELRDKPAGSLRITSVEHASQSILLPALATLLPEYPEISVEIFNDYGLTDIVADRFDAGVRLGEQVAQDMIAVRIGPDFKQCVVGAPAYFKRYGKPKTPHELTAHRCIGLRLPTSGGTWSWPFTNGGHELKLRPGGELAFNTVTLQLDSALAGLGLGYMPEDVVAEHVAGGRLVRVLADWSAPMSGYHLYYPSRRQPTAAFSLLVKALAHRAK